MGPIGNIIYHKTLTLDAFKSVTSEPKNFNFKLPVICRIFAEKLKFVVSFSQ